MEEEKFSPVGKEPREEGPKVKVITLLLFIIVVVVAILIGKNYMLNQRKAEVKAAVVEVLDGIKAGDDITLEKYLKYNDLMKDTETVQEETEEPKEEDKNKTESKKETTTENDVKEEATNTVAENATEESTNTATENTTVENTNTATEIATEDNTNTVNNDVVTSEETTSSETETEENEMFKMLLANVNYEVKNVNVEDKTATVDVSITTKDAGQIFENYFTRAIKVAINQALSSSKYNAGNVEKELETYFEEQVNSSEIKTVTNDVIFKLEEHGGKWEIVSEDKNLTDVVFPNLISKIADLSEAYGEYGD